MSNCVVNENQLDSDENGVGDACEGYSRIIGDEGPESFTDVDTLGDKYVVCGTKARSNSSTINNEWLYIALYNEAGENLFDIARDEGEGGEFYACTLTEEKIIGVGKVPRGAYVYERNFDGSYNISTQYLSGIQANDVISLPNNALALVGTKLVDDKEVAWMYYQNGNKDVIIDQAYDNLFSYDWTSLSFTSMYWDEEEESFVVAGTAVSGERSYGMIVRIDTSGEVNVYRLFSDYPHIEINDLAAVEGEGKQFVVVGSAKKTSDMKELGHYVARIDLESSHNTSSNYYDVSETGQDVYATDLVLMEDYGIMTGLAINGNVLIRYFDKETLEFQNVKSPQIKGADMGNAIAVLESGSLVIVGQHVTYDTGDQQSLLIKTDTSGNVAVVSQ